jgi:uncharacterized heparinase superfamily protein
MARLPAFKIALPRRRPRPNAPGAKAARRDRIRLLWAAAGKLARDQLRNEWLGSAPHRWLIAGPRPNGQAAAPIDLRPARPRRGQAMLAGRFIFDGLPLEVGVGGDPWNRPAPSRAFAEALHRMEWLADLIATEGGARPALSLVLGWSQVFGRWNAFSWSAPVLERRVFNLACALKPLLAEATPAETVLLLDALARQARHLAIGDGDPVRAAEQACATALAGCALAGRAGQGLRRPALARLAKALAISVLPDGGHASRSPEAGLELLYDLRALLGALEQLGEPAPQVVTGAVERLAAGLRFFALRDGRLPPLQGSEASEADRIEAALDGLVASGSGAPALSAPNAGYEILASKRLQALADVSAPAQGAWSRTACAQPMALVVVAGGARLIDSSGWSPRAEGAQALRLTPAASTLSISGASCGRPLQGRLARILGYRLEGAPAAVRARRHEAETGAGLELAHDGWAQTLGLTCQRRLYLDLKTEELRGEDQLAPFGEAAASRGRRPLFLVVRFQLHPDVKASLALDHQSVLLQPKAGGGWWLRNDAPEVSIEPAAHLHDGRPRHAQQVVMRVLVTREGAARIRWKLSGA